MKKWQTTKVFNLDLRETKVGNTSLTLTLTQILATRSCYFYEVILSTKQRVPKESYMPLNTSKFNNSEGRWGVELRSKDQPLGMSEDWN